MPVASPIKGGTNMTKPTPSRARRVRLIAGAFVGTVLALGINAGSASAYEPTQVVKQVQVVEGDLDSTQPTLSRSGIRW